MYKAPYAFDCNVRCISFKRETLFKASYNTVDLAHEKVTDRRLYNTLAPLSTTEQLTPLTVLNGTCRTGVQHCNAGFSDNHFNGNTVGVKIYIPIHVLEMMRIMYLFIIILQLNTRYTTKIHSKISLHGHIHNGLEQFAGANVHRKLLRHCGKYGLTAIITKSRVPQMLKWILISNPGCRNN